MLLFDALDSFGETKNVKRVTMNFKSKETVDGRDHLSFNLESHSIPRSNDLIHVANKTEFFEEETEKFGN